MNKKIIIVIILILAIVLSGILFWNKYKKIDDTKNSNNSTVIYDKEGHILVDTARENEITEVEKDIVIQGLVELNYNGYIYIFNGQHFGEYGFEMPEYTRANIKDKKQSCMDYLTLKVYDTSYIEEGDILICSGDLMKKGYSMGNNDFETKSPIVVLKANDYNKMKQEALSGSEKYYSTSTIGEFFSGEDYIYIKYTLEDDTNSDTCYNFPFAVKAYINDNTKISGDLQKGKKVKVEYEDYKESQDKLKLKSIEVVDNE